MTQPAINTSADASGVAPKLLFTVAEAARALSLSRTTIYALFASGELRSVQIGRARRVPLEAHEAYAAFVARGSDQ
jgi:excisionase family DNA binding protein